MSQLIRKVLKLKGFHEIEDYVTNVHVFLLQLRYLLNLLVLVNLHLQQFHRQILLGLNPLQMFGSRLISRTVIVVVIEDIENTSVNYVLVTINVLNVVVLF